MYKVLSVIAAAIALTACGNPSETAADKAAAPAFAAPAPVAASAVASAPAPAADATVSLTKADIQAMLDEARADTAKQIADAQAAVAEKAAADKAAAEKLALEKRAQRAERAAAQAKAEAAKPVFADQTRRVCEQKTVQVDVPDEVKQEKNPLGMLIGGAIGALAGQQVGGGQGRTLATIAGAAGGAYAGDAYANGNTPAAAGTHKESRNVEICHDVNERIHIK